jgi:hypothetical protein
MGHVEGPQSEPSGNDLHLRPPGWSRRLGERRFAGRKIVSGVKIPQVIITIPADSYNDVHKLGASSLAREMHFIVLRRKF